MYFDTPDDHDLNQKLNGVTFREKYRIRVYDKNSLFGKFEIKRKKHFIKTDPLQILQVLIAREMLLHIILLLTKKY